MELFVGFRCTACLAVHEKFNTYCESCGSTSGLKLLGSYQSKQKPDPGAKHAIGGTQIDKGYRIKCGFPSLDKVFGRPRKGTDADCGMHVPSITLFAGAPGTGKSSLVLGVFSLLPRSTSRLLVSSEQTRGEIAEMIDDMGMTDSLSDLPVVAVDDGGEDWSHVKNVLEEVDPRVLVIDSYNKLRDPEFHNPADRDAHALHLITQLRDDAFANERATIVIAHLNKKLEMRGTKELEHDVSALMMAYKEQTKSRTIVRVVCPTKNRWGKTGVVALFEMGDDGLREIDPEEVRREEEQRRADDDLNREMKGSGAIDPDGGDED